MRSISSFLAGLLAVLVVAPAAAQQTVPAPMQAPAASVPPAPDASAAVAAPVADGNAALTRADAEAWLDGLMPYAIGRGNIPGAVVVIVKDGQVLLQKGYGYADVEKRTPVDPATTLFRPGSVSKLFTWTAVMQLVEQGKLDLDADVNQYLDFKIPPRNDKPVTLRQILTHTTGMEEYVRGLITADPSDAVTLENYIKSWTPTRIFDAGTTPAYSNYATTLAGYIVQRVSGQPFDDYIEQHIFQPLGMQHASFRQPLPAKLLPLMSKGYKAGEDAPKGFEIVNPAPAGSLSASGQDMGQFMIAHLQNGAFGPNRILQEATAKQMHETALTILPPLNRMLLGFYETNVNGHRSITHAGDTQWFHSQLSLFPDDNIGIFVSMNSSGNEGVAGKIRSTLFKGFADRYLPGPNHEGSVDAATAKLHAQQMVGVYDNSRRSDDTFVTLSNLAGQMKVGLNDKGELLIPALTDLNGQPTKWVEIAPYVWRDANGSDRLAAKFENGRIVRFSVDPFSPFMMFEPVPASKSGSWLVPAFLASVVALLLTVLAWPVSALVRRHYGKSYALSGSDAKAHRVIRWTSLAVLAVLIGYIVLLVMMFSNYDLLSPRNNLWVHLLRVLCLITFPLGALIGLWNAWNVLRSRRRKWAKFWAIVLALAFLVLLWVGIAFHMLGYSANY